MCGAISAIESVPQYHKISVDMKPKDRMSQQLTKEGQLYFFEIEGKIYDIGHQVLDKDGIALVGVSPQNSYFNDQNIRILLRTIPAYFKKTKVWFPYEISAITYRALGHDNKGVLKQLRRYANRPRNKCLKNIDYVKENLMLYERGDGSTASIGFVRWNEQVTKKLAFRNKLRRVNELYLESLQFRKDVRQTEYEFFADKLFDPRYSKLVPGKSNIERVLGIGVQYTIQQIAFLLAFPELFGGAFTYIYHDRWPILENLVEGKYGQINGDRIGYLVTISKP